MADQVVNIIVTRTVRQVAITVTPSVPKEVVINVEEVAGPRGLSAYQVAVENGYTGTEVQWLESLKGISPVVSSGERITGVHAGVFGEESLTNDYKYICVQAGTAESVSGAADGTAIWKKQPMFQSI